MLSASGALCAADTDTIRFDIKPQSAGASLMKLAKAAGVQIVMSKGAGEGVSLPAVNGDYTLTQALELILTGTELSYEFTAENMVFIKERDDSSEGAPEDVDEEIVVVGSRLKSTASGSNIVVLTREEIKRQGFGSIEDVIRSLPQNFSDVNASSAQNNNLNSRDAQGQSAINLRGLGTENTLVLVNGRRWVQSPTFRDGTVNLNGIPFSAVERVEVMLDGASAIYGSDALGGVINIVLRESFQGGETIARFEDNRNGGGIWRLEQNASVGWDSGQALLTLSYSETDAVDQKKIFTTLDFRPRGGTDSRFTQVGQPGVVFIGPGFASLPAGDDGTNGLDNLSPDNITPFDPPGIVGAGVTASSENLNARLHIDQEIYDGFNLFGELLYTDNRSTSSSGYSNFAFRMVPTTNRFNDQGRPFFVSYAFVQETLDGLLPPFTTSSDHENLSYTLGFNADLPFAGWTLDFTASHAEGDSSFADFNLLDDVLAERLAGFRDANNNGVMDPGEELPAEQVLNPFGNGTAQNPAALQGLVGAASDGPFAPSNNTAKQGDYLLSANGELFSLPGGDAELALGTEYRTEKLELGSASLDPERDVESYFAELGLPIVGDSNGLPGVESLYLKIALRHDEYRFSGPFNGDDQPFVEKRFSKASPKVDLAWQVVPELKVRMSWGESFRAPNSRDIFAEPFFLPPFIFLPVIDPEFPEFGQQFPRVGFTGNPNLGPETADTKTFGFEWQPTGVLEGLLFSATYTDLDARDRVGTPSLRADAALIFEDGSGVVRGSDNRLISFLAPSLNLALQTSETVDFNIGYDLDTDWGAWQLGLNGTYTSSAMQQNSVTSEPIVLDGTERGQERVKARGSLSWSRDNMAASLFVNYSSSYNNVVRGGGAIPHRVSHYVTYDLNGAYELGESRWKFNGGVRNLFNRKFPFFDGFIRPYDDRRVDTRGRMVYLEVKKSYDIL